MKPSESHPCATGDCDHDDDYECIEALALHADEIYRDLEAIKTAIRNGDTYADDWCPVCEEHPSHNHGGKNCPMRDGDTKREDDE